MTKTAPRRERLRLTLEVLPGPVPEAVRLRRCLKALLRRYGLRCLDIEEENTVASREAAEDRGC